MNLTSHLLIALATLLIAAPLCTAQNGRPAPEPPQQVPTAATAGTANGTRSATDTKPAASQPSTDRHPRAVPPGKVTLAFNDVAVDEVLFKFIVETTGKVVMPVNAVALKTKKVTLMNDEPVERKTALDRLINALRLNGVGVIETDEVVILDLIENMKTKQVQTVLTAADDVMSRVDTGNFVVKIFRLKEAPADGVGEKLGENLPDFASLVVDANSNQILLYSDIATAQHVQILINELDHNWVTPKTETFRLAYADASAVSEQIYELFESSGATQNGQPGGRAPRRQQQANAGRPQPGGAGGQTPPGTTPGPVVELKVSVNVKQNAVTVTAEQFKIDEISKLITEQWDLPTAKETARVYMLQHTDPLKVRDLLQNLLGQGGGGSSRSSGAARGAQGGRGANGIPGGGGGGGGSSVSDVLGDIYRIEAYTDQNSLVVLSKTKESLDYLDSLIERIDQPSSIGLPLVIELKHAYAVSLAEELNVLLAEAGTGGSLDKPASGLSGQGPGGDSTNTGDSGGTGFGGNLGDRGSDGSGGSGGTIEFPWQRGQPRDDQSPETSLIGKVRIVPIVRQNALAIVAPVAQRLAVAEIIRAFDRPGRQVMISAIIAEIQVNDDMALGLRVSSSAINSVLTDNSIAGSVTTSGTKNDIFGSFFDSSVLDANVDVNLLLQAIREKTNLRIVQQPRIFTADNQEAIFFDGQEVPFITDSNTSNGNGGGITQSFEYKKVGVILDVRPRITAQKDVDMEINLEISNVVPGVTILGGAVLDRRQTTTQVIVKNGQTIVLSGIMKDTDSETVREVPLLADIPWLGEFFKSRDVTKKTSELVAFITPIVVDNPSENDDNFNAVERGTLQELVRPLKEQVKDIKNIRQKIVADPAQKEARSGRPEQQIVKPGEPAKPGEAVKDDGQPMSEPPVDIDEPTDDSEPK